MRVVSQSPIMYISEYMFYVRLGICPNRYPSDLDFRLEAHSVSDCCSLFKSYMTAAISATTVHSATNCQAGILIAPLVEYLPQL